MRGLIWTWRVVLAVTVGAFVATAYYMLHGEPDSMENSLPVLNLITVIGAGLVGVAWTLSKRYWHTLILLIALGVLRGLFYNQDAVLTEFQGIYVLVSIGVIGLVFVVTLTARALINDRAVKAAKAAANSYPWMGTVPVGIPVPAPTVPVPTTPEVTATQSAPKQASKPTPRSTAKGAGEAEETVD